MRGLRSFCAAIALGGVMLFASNAQAVMVSFVTVGTFTGGDSAGTSTYADAANGIIINFNSSLNNTVDVNPPSSASFGQFDSTGTTAAAFAPVNSGFTLDIFQTGPAPGLLTFTGTLSGTLKVTNSQAFVQFTGPLTGQIGAVFYSIVSADGGTPGRVAISPPTVNAGVSTIAGLVGVVPEPSSFVLLGLGAPMLLVFRARRNRVAVA